jgi:hypothetical protein
MITLASGITTGRGLSAIVYDSLVSDPCLIPYLDTDDETVAHGTDDFCDESRSSHHLPSVRREQQGWPGHFRRAIVTFGRFGKLPLRPNSNRPNLENWSFTVNIFTRSPVVDENGAPMGEGDLVAQDIYHHVVRILGWDQTPPASQPCGPDFIIYNRVHEGDSFGLSWVEDRRWWQIGTRFRWTVLSRGLIAPPPCIPCGTV